MPKQMCLCRSIMCEKLLPAANNTGGSTCIAPSSTPSSSSAACPRWFDDGGCGDVDNKDFFFLIRSNTTARPVKLYTQWQTVRKRTFTPRAKHGGCCAKTTEKGEGRLMYKGWLVPHQTFFFFFDRKCLCCSVKLNTVFSSFTAEFISCCCWFSIQFNLNLVDCTICICRLHNTIACLFNRVHLWYV